MKFLNKALIVALSFFVVSTQAMDKVLKPTVKTSVVLENTKKIAIGVGAVALPLVVYNADKYSFDAFHAMNRIAWHSGMQPENVKKVLTGAVVLGELAYFYMSATEKDKKEIKAKLGNVAKNPYFLGAMTIAANILAYKSDDYSYAIRNALGAFGVNVGLHPYDAKKVLAGIVVLCELLAFDIGINGFYKSYTKQGLDKSGITYVSQYTPQITAILLLLDYVYAQGKGDKMYTEKAVNKVTEQLYPVYRFIKDCLPQVSNTKTTFE